MECFQHTQPLEYSKEHAPHKPWWGSFTSQSRMTLLAYSLVDENYQDEKRHRHERLLKTPALAAYDGWRVALADRAVLGHR